MLPNKQLLLPFLFLAGFLLASCSSLEKVGQVLEGRKPTATVLGLKLAGLDSEGVALTFDVMVDNPNPVGVSLAGFDYDLKLGGRRFLQGEQPLGLKLPANGSSRVQVPVRLVFQTLMERYTELKNSDWADYQVDLGMAFSVPVLGRVRVPVRYEGRFPIPRMPEIRLRSLDVQQLSIKNAKLLLQLEVNNPNAFSIAVGKFDYNLKLNGLDAGRGQLQKPVDIRQGGQGVVGLPLSLDFAETGLGLYKALLGGAIRYELNGSLEALGTTPILQPFQIPLEKRGSVNLR